MSITNVGTHYLVEGLLDHKENIEVGGIPMYQAKNFENNLRERNPNLGIVYGVSKENTLNLKAGDYVITSHFAFTGGIGVNKSYEMNDHVVLDGKKLFKIHPNDIHFTYNDQVIAPIGSYLGVEKVEDTIEQSGIATVVLHSDRGRVIYPNCGIAYGTEVLLEQHALYKVTFNKQTVYRIRESEIVGIIHEEKTEGIPAEDLLQYSDNPLLMLMMQKTAKKTGRKTVTPYKGRILVEDLFEPSENQINYPDIYKIPRDNDAKVIAVGEMTEKQKHENNHIKAGDTVYRARNSGIRFGKQFLASMVDDTVHFIYERDV